MKYNIYWIGGSSCAGKSSCSKMIAEKCNFVLYNTDKYAFGKYMFGIENNNNFPAIEKYKNQLLQGVNKFILRETEISFKTILEYCYEVFPLIKKDITELAKNTNVIVEGVHILPELLEVEELAKSIFLISSEEQQRRIWLREMNKEIVGGNEYEIKDYQETTQKQAFEQARIRLHVKIAEHIKKQADKRKAKYIELNNDKSIDEIYEDLIAHYNI